jgi:hypothetical protein
MLFLNAEILISSQLGMQPETTTKSQMEFGGGDFSGGGSSGSFRYKAQHLLIIKIKVILEKLSKAYAIT